MRRSSRCRGDLRLRGLGTQDPLVEGGLGGQLLSETAELLEEMSQGSSMGRRGGTTNGLCDVVLNEGLEGVPFLGHGIEGSPEGGGLGDEVSWSVEWEGA